MQDDPRQETVPAALPKARVWDFVATGLYSGKLPGAPGTWGTAAAAIVYYALFRGELETTLGAAVFAVIMTAIAIVSTDKVVRAGIYGGAKDPQQIVIDEFAGYAVTLIGGAATPKQYLLAFILFRLFDVTKLYPACRAEQLPGAWGIVLDDIVAGFYACICLAAANSLLF